MNKTIKNIGLGTLATVVIIVVVGTYKFNYLVNLNGYNIDGNKIISGESVVCDENLVRYKDNKEAKIAGLKEEQFGATFCPEYKMHPSWDKNKDGINDYYEGNSCDPKIDYMSPKK